jgi:hypothetical protein
LGVKLLNEKWVDAPAYTEVTNKKRRFEAMVWLYADDMGSDMYVRCFMPGVEA